MNRLNFVAVTLKVLLVNLLAALNFANVFFKIKKNVWKIKNVKNVKKRDQNNNKTLKNVFYIYGTKQKQSHVREVFETAAWNPMVRPSPK